MSAETFSFPLITWDVYWHWVWAIYRTALASIEIFICGCNTVKNQMVCWNYFWCCHIFSHSEISPYYRKHNNTWEEQSPKTAVWARHTELHVSPRSLKQLVRFQSGGSVPVWLIWGDFFLGSTLLFKNRWLLLALNKIKIHTSAYRMFMKIYSIINCYMASLNISLCSDSVNSCTFPYGQLLMCGGLIHWVRVW